MLDEADHVEDLIADVAAQDYPGEVELLVADGGSTDGSPELLRRACAERRIRLTVLANPRRWVSPGLNACIERATGDAVVRLDCHARYPSGYVRSCVELLEASGAWNVGGRLVPTGRTPTERAVACAMETAFGGIGWTRHGESGGPREVDTVTFGAFPAWVFGVVGGFDEELVRNQDNDLNARIRRAGGAILLDPSITVRYIPRGSYRRLFRQYLEYGLWKGRVTAKHGEVLNVRSVVPLVFVVSLATLAPLAGAGRAARRALALELTAYGLGCLCFAVQGVGRRHEDPALTPRVVAVFPVFHVAHGLGMLRALSEGVRRRR